MEPGDVDRLAQGIGERYGLMVSLGAMLGLRWGEVAGLRRHRIDVNDRSLLVCEQVVVTNGGGVTLGPPKSQAGNRRLAVPEALLDLIERHAERFAIEPEGLLCTTEFGSMLHPSNFRQRVWLRARREAGLPTVGFTICDGPTPRRV